MSTAIVPFTEIHSMAEAIASSGLFGVKTPTQALALMLVAQANGQHPAAAARDFDIIGTRPAKKAEAMLRDFIQAGGAVKWHALDDTQADATFSHPAGGTVKIHWDMKRAAQVGLAGKDMWKKWPRQMLRSRCVSEGVRTIYPAATGGLYAVEEVQDMPPRPQAADVSELVEVEAPAFGGLSRERYEEIEAQFGQAEDMESIAGYWMAITKEERKAVSGLKDRAKARLEAAAAEFGS